MFKTDEAAVTPYVYSNEKCNHYILTVCNSCSFHQVLSCPWRNF